MSSSSKPASKVVPYRLQHGGGGQLIDPEGLFSAVRTLHLQYGDRLDVAALYGWLLQRQDGVWATLDVASQRQEEAALAFIEQWLHRSQSGAETD